MVVPCRNTLDKSKHQSPYSCRQYYYSSKVYLPNMCYDILKLSFTVLLFYSLLLACCKTKTALSKTFSEIFPIF